MTVMLLWFLAQLKKKQATGYNYKLIMGIGMLVGAVCEAAAAPGLKGAEGDGPDLPEAGNKSGPSAHGEGKSQCGARIVRMPEA
jgi:hypothetical protein